MLEERLVQLFTAEQLPFLTHVIPRRLQAAATQGRGRRHTPEASPTPGAARALALL